STPANDAVVELFAEGTNASRFEVPVTTDVLNQVFLRQDGTKTLTADWAVGSHKITGLTPGAGSGEVVEYDQLHAQLHAAAHADGAADTLAALTVKVANLNVGSKIKQDSAGASVVWQTKDVVNAAIAWQAWNGSAQETIAVMAAASSAGQAYYRLDKPAFQKQTITLDANGDISGVTGSMIYLTSNAGSADTLVGIDAMPESRMLFLTPTAGHDITLEHNGAPTAGSKMLISGEANVVLNQDHDFAIAVYDPTAVAWKVMVPGLGGGTHPVALATDVSGILAAANIDAAIARDSELHAQLHKTAHAAAGGDALFSVGQYAFLPDAAIDADVVAGAQKQLLVSAGADETLTRIVVHATAAGGTALTVTLEQYQSGGAGVEDTDSAGAWATVKALTVTASNKTVVNAAPSATIKSRGALRISIGGTVTGWKNVTATYEVKRPLSA
ncbi:hypothetical protein LCGC14_1529750, partial [marine sediment metagenome]